MAKSQFSFRPNQLIFGSNSKYLLGTEKIQIIPLWVELNQKKDARVRLK